MAYRALYRAYRPTRFEEVIGQEHIVTTLRHQVAEGRVAHAYLFCGTRGTGKTTSARILSRAINCTNPQDGEPCGECDACRASLSGICPDIIEIDAASNSGVDNVRDLIEKAQLAPLSMKYRVYIIDEVHMLSNAAFNALLKTLEEPPEHAVFILATTEPQKLLATIISRCQRYDFHRLSVQDIVSTLRSVLKKANASIEEGGLMLIARAADGGMRDALSLTDQCLAFCGDRVSKKDVYDVLGSMEEGFLFEIVDALLSLDAVKALTMLGEIVHNGRDLSVFASDLAAHFRALLIAKTCGGGSGLIDCTEDTLKRYLAEAKNASEPQLLRALTLLLNAERDMRYLTSPRTLLESTLVKICRPEDEASFTALAERVERLEKSGVRAEPVREPVQEPVREPVPPPEEARYEDVPWDDAPPPEEEAYFAEGLPAFHADAPQPTGASEPVREPVREPADTNADGMWSAVLGQIQKLNPMLHMLAKSASAESYADGLLTVGVAESEETIYRSLTAKINQNAIQTAASAVREGLRVQVVRTRTEPASDEVTAKARALFGDKLVIE